MQQKTEHLEINLDLAPLENLKAVLSSIEKETVKMGILGSSGAKGSPAYIAAVHEFGAACVNIPQRSFLRLPMLFRGKDFQKFVEAGKDAIFRHMLDGTWIDVLEQFGVKWVSYIHDAFDTRGFGTWKPLKPATIARRKNHSSEPLLDTGLTLRANVVHKVDHGK